jgi:4-hydroxy-tetrahydrodipicolinate synthase
MATQIEWAGIFPAALTMFDDAGHLDEEATAAHLDRLVRDGAHGVIVAGTSGEFIGLDERERRRVIELGVEVVRKRVPVIAGTGWFSTSATIAQTAHAAAAGADGAIVILPYYQRPSPVEVLEHYREVGRASPIPIMVYNNPANSGAPALEPAQIRELYEGGYAHAIKSTFPTVHQVHELRAEIDDGFRVFYGSFMAPLEGLAGGAHGWVSGILNVATTDAIDLWTAMRAGDLEAARAAWQRILPIKLLYTRQLLGPVSDLAIYRGILRLRGQAAGYCRAPLLDLSPDQTERLRVLLERDALVPLSSGELA